MPGVKDRRQILNIFLIIGELILSLLFLELPNTVQFFLSDS